MENISEITVRIYFFIKVWLCPANIALVVLIELLCYHNWCLVYCLVNFLYPLSIFSIILAVFCLWSIGILRGVFAFVEAT